MSVRLCLLLAALATAMGLGLRMLVPVQPPDPEFLGRLEHWKSVAADFDRERAERSRKPRWSW
jgi:hypothetical protein